MTLSATAFAPSRSEHVLSVEVCDEVVVYDPVGDALHLLDPVAATVWASLDGQTPVDVLARQLAVRAQADERRVISDVRSLLGRLRGTGVVGPGPVVPTPRRADAQDLDDTDDPPSWSAAGPLPALSTPHATSPFRALRHHFRVVTNLPDVRAWLDTVLVDLVTPEAARDSYTVLDEGPGPTTDRYVLGFNGHCVARSGWLARILDLLLWHVNTEAAARSAGSFVLLHAAAAARDGRAVLLPAPMENGKTTTVAGLVRSGWQYLTDEMVALDPVSLRAFPYPRPMCIDRGSWEVLAELRPSHAERVTGQWQVPASNLGAGAVAGDAAPAAVVAPRYRAGAATSLRRMSPGEVVLEMAESAFAFRADPARNLEALAQLARQVPGYRLTISRLDHAVALIDLVMAT